MASFVAAARRCDASAGRGAGEPLQSERLAPGRLSELLSGPLRRPPVAPPDATAAGPPTCAKVHGGMLGGGGVLNEGVMVPADRLGDLKSSRPSLHHHVATRVARLVGAKLSGDSGLSRVERLLQMRQRRKAAAPPPAREQDCADHPRFASVGAHRALAMVAKREFAASRRREQHSAHTAALAAFHTAEEEEHLRAGILREECDGAASVYADMRSDLAVIAATEAAAEREHLRAVNARWHPIDVLRMAIQRDILDERAELYATADSEWGYSFHERLDRMIDAERDVHVEDHMQVRQEVMVALKTPPVSCAAAAATPSAL